MAKSRDYGFHCAHIARGIANMFCCCLLLWHRTRRHLTQKMHHREGLAPVHVEAMQVTRSMESLAGNMLPALNMCQTMFGTIDST